MFKRRKHAELTILIDEVEQLKLKSQAETPTSHHILLQSDDSELQELIDSMNGLLDTLQIKYENLHVKHEIVTELN